MLRWRAVCGVNRTHFTKEGKAGDNIGSPIPSRLEVTQFTKVIDRSFFRWRVRIDFIPVVTWRQLAETCVIFLYKGHLTVVEGRIRVWNYENNELKKVFVTEIIADNISVESRWQ